MDRSDIAMRMKAYENVAKIRLMPNEPVIIRVDGRAFHTFTRGFIRPFDNILIKSVQETMKYLCENVQCCVLGYCQSDEITLVLIDYKDTKTHPFFDNEVQKICSIVASMATLEFNRRFQNNVLQYSKDKYIKMNKVDTPQERYALAISKGAMFDARCFNVPRDEVTNCIYWRQLDATRNSIESVGQAHFSHKELQNKNCNMIQDMLMTQKELNWNDLSTYLKRGSCCIKKKTFVNKDDLPEKFKGDLETYVDPIDGVEQKGVWRNLWYIDNEIPQFKGEGRKYIERLL